MNGNLKLLTAPDWSMAPKNFTWFAIDEDGDGFFYEDKPIRKMVFFIGKFSEWAGTFDATDWKNSLQKRPE